MNQQRSYLEEAISSVEVHPAFQNGISVTRISNEGKARRVFLTISRDKFCLFITTTKLDAGKVTSSFLNRGIERPLISRICTIVAPGIGGGDSNAGTSNQENQINEEETTTNENGDPQGDYYSYSDKERVIDICSIDRIQLGQNTLQFEEYRRAQQQGHELYHGWTPRSPMNLLQRKRIKNNINSLSSDAEDLNNTQSNDRKNANGSIYSMHCRNESNGDNTSHNQNSTDVYKYREFSIIFRGERSLAIIADSGNDGLIIIDCLDRLIREYLRAKMRIGKDALLLRYIWIDVDRDQSDHINLSELQMVLNRINYYITKQKLKDKYIKFIAKIGLDRRARSRGLTFSQCVTFFHMIKRDNWMRKPIQQIWANLFGELRSNGQPRLKISVDTFLKKFLHKSQRQFYATEETTRALFRRLNNLEIATLASNVDGGEDYIDKNRFEEYLNSRENDIFDPEKELCDPNMMNESIFHYWINSSHNTYLVGDQLQSRSSVQMYLAALYRGCRCLEIDIWDGEIDHEFRKPVPIVKHGNTLTSKIAFFDIIEAINMFMVINPDTYPIILSLENHCSFAYQEVMAEQLVKVFGERLFIPTQTDLEQVHTPESLKGKVLLKGLRCDIGDEDDYESVDIDLRDDTDETVSLRSETTGREKIRFRVCPALSRLTFFHGSSFKSFQKSRSNPAFYMHSFSEKRILQQLKHRRDFIMYNQDHMSRSFPSAIRVTSNNYNPLTAWSAGCQMVALNFQTADYPLRLNDGRFRANGRCGYVLKPQNMLQDRFIHCVGGGEPIRLVVEVFGAYRLPKPKGQRRGECIDPYVEVRLADVDPRDGREITSERKTNIVKNNGFFPIWSSEPFEFTVQSQHVAMLQFTVWDEDHGKNDDFIASSAIPVSCIRTGFRSVQLFDAKNSAKGAFDVANLLVQVQLERSLTK